MTDIVSTINNSISIVKRLREISKNMEEAEFRNLLADLSNDLGDAKLEIADLKEKLAKALDELRELKAAQHAHEGPKPRLQWGCYKFEGEEGLFCTACFDTKGKKHRASRMDGGKYYQCTVCNAKLA